MLPEHDRYLIEYERLRAVFVHAPVTNTVTIINAILVAVFLAPLEPASYLSAWAAAAIVVSVLRWIGVNAFWRHSGRGPVWPWCALSIGGAMTAGILWGIAGTLLFPPVESYQLLLALVIAGMCSGLLAVNAAHLPTVVAFVLPSCLPLIVSFLSAHPMQPVPAVMVAVFAAALVTVGVGSHRAFGAHTELRFALSREQQKLTEANRQLLAEIAQRRSTEAILHQAQKMDAIGHLTGGIAHDFNNLLQVMIGNLEIIRDLAGHTSRVAHYADIAEQAARRGSGLTNSLLTFARQQSLEAKIVDVNALVLEFEPILKRTLPSNVHLGFDPKPDLLVCEADPAHFQSAILNLVINARDAMPDGGAMTVSTGMDTLTPSDLAGNDDAQSGQFIFVSISDSGTGMTEETLARVCEPFFTTKEAGKGTGLGLSQVYGFARQSGGHLDLQSQVNVGTTATLWLPVAHVDVEAEYEEATA